MQSAERCARDASSSSKPEVNERVVFITLGYNGYNRMPDEFRRFGFKQRYLYLSSISISAAISTSIWVKPRTGALPWIAFARWLLVFRRRNQIRTGWGAQLSAWYLHDLVDAAGDSCSRRSWGARECSWKQYYHKIFKILRTHLPL